MLSKFFTPAIWSVRLAYLAELLARACRGWWVHREGGDGWGARSLSIVLQWI